jgi:competence protein ComEC
VSVTIFAAGASWAAVRRGEHISATGVAARDTFGPVPAVVIRARGAPRVTAPPPWWLRWADTARASLTRSAGALDADRGGLLRGISVGDTRGIDARLSADTKITGLAHLVAVSGTHMAIAGGVVILILRRFGPRVTAVGAAATMAAMVMLVGPQPSVLRSVVMGLIGVMAAVLGRAKAALPGLAAAVFGLLLADPTLAVSAGFALSVQATAGLVLLAPAWVRALRRRGVPPGWATLLVLPVAAHLATLPVIAAISGRVSLVAIPANIAVGPVVAPALLLGLACLAVSPWWPGCGVLLARCDGPLLGWITATAHRLARWPAATVPWPATPVGVLALTAVVLAGLLALRHRRIRAAVAVAVAGALAVVIPAHVTAIGWPVAGWLLTACEVGQGDGLVLSTGLPHTAVVVDTGPDPPAMDGCLHRLGIESVPLLVLTHFHADHVDGLPGALAGRAVGAIGIGPGREPAAGWDSVRSEAATADVPLVALRTGTTWRVGDLTLRILGPAHTYHGTDSDPNNDSVVMMATRHGVRILMTGDIERPAQRALMASGADLHADVLKQPHHGSSKLVPAFVAAVDPTVAVVGVGADNDYGQPAASALRTDRAAGVRTILRTDTEGDVEVCVRDGNLCTAERGPARASPRVAAASGG